jgi:polyhydroxybutyrate depolymerase
MKRQLLLLLALGTGLVSTALIVACSDDETAASPGGGTSTSSSTSSSGEEGEGGASSSSSGDGGGQGGGDGGMFDKRPYRTTVPSKYDKNKPTPLVVLLHGYTGNSKQQDDYFGVSKLAEEKTFLVGLPDGTKDSQGNQFWNATDACCGFLSPPVDDVAYLAALIDDMKSKYNVDPKRVYIVGHSNGGFMANRFACDHAKTVAAIVSLAGATYQDASKCKADDGVAVLQVHGDNDTTVKYAGGAFFNGLPLYPSAAQTVATWAAKNGCDATLTTTATKIDLESGLAGDETTVARHTCPTKGAAELWTIVSGGHIPNFQTTWAAQFYAFMEAHPKP